MNHFDLILLITSFIVPLALSVQHFVDKRKSVSRTVMASTLLATGVVYIFNYLYFVEDYTLYLPIHGLHAGLEFLIFPSIYIYIKTITTPNFTFRKIWVHYIPFIVVTIAAIYIFYIKTTYDDLTFFLLNNRRGYSFTEPQYLILVKSRYVHLIFLALQTVYYTFSFIRIPKEYDEKLKEEFSNIENFSIKWINNYLLSLAIVVIIGFALYALIPLEGFHKHVIVVLFAVFSAYISRLGIIALRQESAYENFNEDEIVDVDSAPKDSKLISALSEYMETEKPFLKPDICLTTLSKQLGTNRTYLSTLINQHYGKNFNAYINDYRIDFVKKYHAENPTVSREDLYQLAGFGSLSTMMRAMNKCCENSVKQVIPD